MTAEQAAKTLKLLVDRLDTFLHSLGKGPALQVARCKLVETQMWGLRHLDGSEPPDED